MDSSKNEAWGQLLEASERVQSKIVRLPPTDMRMSAMVRRLHLALNTDEDIEMMYSNELIASIQQMDMDSRQKFVELFNAQGGRVTLKLT